jgi:hypothetical protein
MTSTRVSHVVGLCCAAVTFAIGVAALTGWVLDSEPLKTVFIGNISVKTNTAIGLACLGLSLFCLAPNRRQPWQVTLGRTIAVVPVVIG